MMNLVHNPELILIPKALMSSNIEACLDIKHTSVLSLNKLQLYKQKIVQNYLYLRQKRINQNSYTYFILKKLYLVQHCAAL